MKFNITESLTAKNQMKKHLALANLSQDFPG